jgi:hypothetical protein
MDMIALANSTSLISLTCGTHDSGSPSTFRCLSPSYLAEPTSGGDKCGATCAEELPRSPGGGLPPGSGGAPRTTARAAGSPPPSRDHLAPPRDLPRCRVPSLPLPQLLRMPGNLQQSARGSSAAGKAIPLFALLHRSPAEELPCSPSGALPPGSRIGARGWPSG